jgi:transglutaminase/protease-like cytokinesis protein 3
MSKNIKSVFILFLLLTIEYAYAQNRDFSAINFHRADSIADAYNEYPLTDAMMLSRKLTSRLHSDVEKFRAIYKWICNNIEFDYALYLENKLKRYRLKGEDFTHWNDDFNQRWLRTLIDQRRTICTGYAFLLRELCAYAGIKCVIVDGYGRTKSKHPNHSWNAVQLNNKWYLCDVTWASGYMNMDSLTYKKDYNEKYFLPDPVKFANTHKPLDNAWSLL